MPSASTDLKTALPGASCCLKHASANAKTIDNGEVSYSTNRDVLCVFRNCISTASPYRISKSRSRSLFPIRVWSLACWLRQCLWRVAKVIMNIHIWSKVLLSGRAFEPAFADLVCGIVENAALPNRIQPTIGWLILDLSATPLDWWDPWLAGWSDLCSYDARHTCWDTSVQGLLNAVCHTLLIFMQS